MPKKYHVLTKAEKKFIHVIRWKRYRFKKEYELAAQDTEAKRIALLIQRVREIELLTEVHWLQLRYLAEEQEYLEGILKDGGTESS